MLYTPCGCCGSCSWQTPWGYHLNCRPQLVYRFGGDAIIARPEFCSKSHRSALAASACRLASGLPCLCRCGIHAIDIRVCLQLYPCSIGRKNMLDQQGCFIPNKKNCFHMLHAIALHKGYENTDRANFTLKLFATLFLFVHHKVSCFTNTRSGYCFV